uniref:Uncharacterized protein n=1 Tax=Anguilla anguilla TaxID=7936 RepID=A0A0E9PY98_ANGAN
MVNIPRYRSYTHKYHKMMFFLILVLSIIATDNIYFPHMYWVNFVDVV